MNCRISTFGFCLMAYLGLVSCRSLILGSREPASIGVKGAAAKAISLQGEALREEAGKAIWFKSAPNSKYHSYYFPQKVNSPIAWNKVLRSDLRSTRFPTWGLINDPDCCVPGQNCDSRHMRFHNRPITMEDTFGWDFCPGDEVLLDAIRSRKDFPWKDPACDDPIVRAADALDLAPRENSCELAFGNSTGVVGFRKFPNPRFNQKRWQKIGGWKGYEERMSEGEIDASVEPPFRVGLACASCHAAFDPVRPPQDVNNPLWINILGEVGNQYLQMTSILGSGVRHDSIESQIFLQARPGTVDTSAVPNDYIRNPGTTNAVINWKLRPLFNEVVSRWVQSSGCEGPHCQVINYAGGKKKYWQKKTESMKVMHILKGGEDSAGSDLGVQRVYLNIGMCAEKCVVNHLSNNRELNPSQRGFGQTPFSIEQCRADCAAFRANEDRVQDILSFLLSRPSRSLAEALFPDQQAPERLNSLKNFVNERYKSHSGERLLLSGRKIFAQNCASCHSSRSSEAWAELQDHELRPEGDWMGNDKLTPALQVGTSACRSRHSNHMQGHIWQELTSQSYASRKAAGENLRHQPIDKGRGYYRNISLLDLWAYAPLMHNNAIGPEVCGSETDRARGETCEAYFDPSIEGRLNLFDKSTDEMLTPSKNRRKKITRTLRPMRLPLGVKFKLGDGLTPDYLEIPAGIPVQKVGSFDLKGFAADLLGVRDIYEKLHEPAAQISQVPAASKEEHLQLELGKYWLEKMNGDRPRARQIETAVASLFASLKNHQVGSNLFPALDIIFSVYSNCEGLNENLGHDYGTDLSTEEKNALKAFLATL